MEKKAENVLLFGAFNIVKVRLNEVLVQNCFNFDLSYSMAGSYIKKHLLMDVQDPLEKPAR